jgi:hypothetical protein
MASNSSEKKNKKSSSKKTHSKSSSSTKTAEVKEKHSFHHENFKEELLKIDNEEDKYDKLFEQKLSTQYREFRNLKEHSSQSKKFYGIIGFLILLILAVILVLSFG